MPKIHLIKTLHHLVFLLAGALTVKAENLCIKDISVAPTDEVTRLINQSFLLDNLIDLEKAGFSPLIEDSLESWKIHNDLPEVKFTLEDGVISGTAEKLKGNSFLYTNKEFTDYLLYFEFRFDHVEGNSGLMYHSHYNKDGEFAGYQFEMDNPKKGKQRQWTGLLYAENAGGWLYPNRDKKIEHQEITRKEWLSQFTTKGLEALDQEGWNSAFIRVKGSHYQTWLNGVLRTDFINDSPEALTKGAIALQIHGGASCAVSWKNIFILPLTQEVKPEPTSN